MSARVRVSCLKGLVECLRSGNGGNSFISPSWPKYRHKAFIVNNRPSLSEVFHAPPSICINRDNLLSRGTRCSTTWIGWAPVTTRKTTAHNLFFFLLCLTATRLRLKRLRKTLVSLCSRKKSWRQQRIRFSWYKDVSVVACFSVFMWRDAKLLFLTF